MNEAVSGSALRAVMRRVPAPVTVATACAGGRAGGITIGSFTSVALTPPLISFNVSGEVWMHGVIEAADRFALHLLSDRQAPLADRFAVPDQSYGEQFDGVAHRRDAEGTPIIDDVKAVLHCQAHAQFPAGDHTIFVGRVVAIDAGSPDQAAEAARPLLYYRRTYRTVEGEELSVEEEAVKRASRRAP